MSLSSDEELSTALDGSPWERSGDGIAREVELADFAAAIALVNRVAEAAEAANHHPDILVHGWNKVRLELCTHSGGGITQADVDMARTLDGIV
jgi:4a-hydroxytetrahydrobiopterin dehydratase